MQTSAKSKSCDWLGSAASEARYLEVKTLNHSDDERKSWYDDKAKLVHTTRVPAPLMAKAKELYAKAKKQLDAMPAASDAKKLVLFVVNADHNFDPFEESVRDLLLREFTAIEDPNYFIHLDVRTPNDN